MRLAASSLIPLALLALLASSSACHRTPPTPIEPTELVVGVQSDPMGGIVSALHVVIRAADKVVDDEWLRPPHGSKVGFPQPWEKRISGEGLDAARVDVEVDAMGDPTSQTPLFKRLSSTHFVPKKTALLRIPLESRCVVYPQVPRGTSRVPGPLSGPTCTAPFTCISGICQPSDVSPMRLEAYAKNWPTNAPDRCKPQNGGPPDLQIGTGQSYFLPLAKEQILTAEAGAQGGHHIWIAARMKNLKQAGTTTKITGVQPGTGATIPPTTLAFTYAPDEGGYCKLYGLRYQLDNEGVDYKQFLGKPLDVTVTATDPTGATATATTRINVAPNILNP